MRSEPFAIQIYRRFLNGESIAAIALELGIPADRIEVRIRAAARFCQTGQPGASGSRYAA